MSEPDTLCLIALLKGGFFNVFDDFPSIIMLNGQRNPRRATGVIQEVVQGKA